MIAVFADTHVVFYRMCVLSRIDPYVNNDTVCTRHSAHAVRGGWGGGGCYQIISITLVVTSYRKY